MPENEYPVEDRDPEQVSTSMSHSREKQNVDCGSVAGEQKEPNQEDIESLNEDVTITISQLPKRDSIEWSLMISGHYFHPSFWNLISNRRDKFKIKANQIFFRLTSVDYEILKKAIEGFKRKKIPRKYRHILLNHSMRNGPHNLQVQFTQVTNQDIIKWVKDTDTKLLQVEGRPVQNIFLDKVSMSTLSLLLDLNKIPFYDSFFALCIVSYISGENQMGKSYGWKRKYKQRFQRYRRQPHHEYLSYPLPEPQLKEFIPFVVNRVKQGFKKRSPIIVRIQKWAADIQVD